MKKDNSMKVAYWMMAIGAILGLPIGGLGGALIGVGVGFAVTSLVFLTQEGIDSLDK